MKMRKFRLKTDRDGRNLKHVQPKKDGQYLFVSGNVVASPRDLVKRFGRARFEEVDPETPESPGQKLNVDPEIVADPDTGRLVPAPVSYPDLDTLSVTDLRRIATNEEIDVSGLKTREAIRDKLREVLQGVSK